MNPINEIFNKYGLKSYIVSDEILNILKKFIHNNFSIDNHYAALIIEINELTHHFIAIGFHNNIQEYGECYAIIDTKTNIYRGFTPALIGCTGKFGLIFSYNKDDQPRIGNLIIFKKLLPRRDTSGVFHSVITGKCFIGKNMAMKNFRSVSMLVFSIGLGWNLVTKPFINYFNFINFYYDQGLISRIVNSDKTEVINLAITPLIGFDQTFSYRESEIGLLESYFDYFEVKDYNLGKYECAPISAIKEGFKLEKTAFAKPFPNAPKFNCLESEYGTVILTAISFKVRGLDGVKIGDIVGLFYGSFSNTKISDGFVHEINLEYNYCSVVFFTNLEEIKIDDYSTTEIGYIFKLGL